MGEVNQVVYQYQRLVIQYKDLEKQLKQKEEQWKEMQDRFGLVEMHARELCEDILAKDKSETGLGKNYSWSSVDILELLKKAKSSFQGYNGRQTKLLKQILEQSEARRKELEKLKAQPFQQALSENPRISETIKKTQEVLEEQEISDQQKHEIHSMISFMDDADFTDGIIDETVHVSGAKTIAHKTMQQSNNAHNKDKGKNTQSNTVSDSNITMDEIDIITSGLTKDQKIIVRVVGSTGKWTLKDIYEDYQQYGSLSMTLISNEFFNLQKDGLLEKRVVNEGLCPRKNIYFLTALGEAAYIKLYRDKPVMSQYAKVIGEHSTLEHGLNILMLASHMRKYPKVYGYIREWNREIPIDVQIPIYDVNTKKVEMTNRKYVPDIIFKYRNEEQAHYIEYERNTCTKEQFYEKCEKMIRVTRVLRFVTPNAKETNEIIDRIKLWIQKRKDRLPKCKILVTSCKTFQKGDMSTDEQWDYLYDSASNEWFKH